MNPARYQELLGRLFEGELTEPEAGELAGELQAQPALQLDLHRHLVLWEAWSQHQAPERSAEAFVAGWKTRLRAENEETDAFFRKVRAQLETRGRRVTAWFAQLRGAMRRPTGIAWATSAVLAGLAVVFWLAVPHPAQAMVTIQGEAVCPACVLHEGHAHVPAIRVHTDGTPRIYYLERSPALTGLQGRFCSGPTPATVEGQSHTVGGREMFTVSHIELPPPPPKKPTADQRILFPL
jgi:hypothetical protein